MLVPFGERKWLQMLAEQEKEDLQCHEAIFSDFSMIFRMLSVFFFLSALFITACGQKGPLYLPCDKAEPKKQVA